MKERELKNTKFIKLILMLMVIFGHSCAFWSGRWFTGNPIIESRSLNIFYSWINSFHTYGFTLVAGYIYAFKMREGQYSMYLSFLCKKVKRLLVPYIFIMCIWVAPISAYFFNWDSTYLFKKYILCIDPSQLWFLWMLFWVFVIIWPLWKIITKNSITGWSIVLVLYCIGVIGKKVLPNIFCIWTSLQYVPFFFVGIRIRLREEEKEERIAENIPWIIWFVLDVCIFGFFWVTEHMNGLIWNLISLGLGFLVHAIGATMTWATLQIWASYINWERFKYLKILSSYSMPMYLFHQQIIYFIISVTNGKINPWINAVINFIVAIIVSFVISAIFMRWKVTRVLIGEK